jgi:hypothetical protein
MSEQNHGIDEPPHREAAEPDDLALRLAQATLNLSMYRLIVFALGMCLYITL